MHYQQAFRNDQSPSRHYRARAAERRLDPKVEEFLMRWGTEIRAAGAMHTTIVRRDLPTDVCTSKVAARAMGWILVASDDGSLITCYRRRDAWRFLRRKSERRWDSRTR